MVVGQGRGGGSSSTGNVRAVCPWAPDCSMVRPSSVAVGAGAGRGGGCAGRERSAPATVRGSCSFNAGAAVEDEMFQQYRAIGEMSFFASTASKLSAVP